MRYRPAVPRSLSCLRMCGIDCYGRRAGPNAFAARMNLFYRGTTDILVWHDAIIDKQVGDEVMALLPSIRDLP